MQFKLVDLNVEFSTREATHRRASFAFTVPEIGQQIVSSRSAPKRSDGVEGALAASRWVVTAPRARRRGSKRRLMVVVAITEAHGMNGPAAQH